MKRLYLAAKFETWPLVKWIAQEIREAGAFEVVSTWHDKPHAFSSGNDDFDADANRDEARQFVHVDLADIDRADVLVLISPSPPYPGTNGRVFEAGYAVGKGKALWTVYGPENLFTGRHSRLVTWRFCGLSEFMAHTTTAKEAV